MSVTRTYIVPAWIHQDRDDWVDDGAYAAGGGLDSDLPAYHGVWIDPEHGKPWHMFTDYPMSVHDRFGWRRAPVR